jgi:hypothetical protein
MQHLLELSKLINAHHLRHIEVLTNASTGEESRYYRCWQGVSKGKFKTREDIAKAFGIKVGDRSLDRLIQGTTERAMKSLVFIQTNTQEEPTYEDELMRIRRDWAQIKLLAERGALRTNLELADKLLSDALKLDLADTAFEIIRFIRRNALVYPDFHTYYERVSELYEEYHAKSNQIAFAEKMYQDIVYPMSRQRGYKNKYALPAQSARDTLQPFLVENDLIGFRWHFYLIDYFASALAYDFETALDKARQAKDFFFQKRPDFKRPFYSFAIQEIVCLINLGRYDEAYPLCEECLLRVKSGSLLWFKILETRAAAHIRQQNWTAAWGDVLSARQHEEFDNTPNIDRDTWAINYTILVLVHRLKKHPAPPNHIEAANAFGTQNLFDKLAIARSDKQGANFTFLLLELYFILLDQQTDLFESRVEAIRKYAQRNVFDDPARFRTRHFIRLLDLLGRTGADRPSIDKKAAPILEELVQIKVDVFDHTYEVEPVPYEIQWNWILDLMQAAYAGQPPYVRA